MKILKKILIVILIIIAIPLVIALFVKKDYAVQREVVINKPKQPVFDYIKYLKNQDHYAIWNQMDPAMQKDYKGTDGEPGFSYSWKSAKEEVGQGEQVIKTVTPGESMETTIHFIKPFEGLATARLSTTAVNDNQTKVTWSFSSGMKYPMNFLLLFMDMDKMLGKDLEQGLANLKGVLEK
ncbi:SRPBCC family protein [Chitinophaga sp. Mgbs1]|uniref:SRPBCC family protein n=1 Tax=Chitinophaga solisilvae TaxID=1233460 RepID=A0A3S1B343_9BACT|nr:SRPBCC family protein [Chitinophaga solisilvae]